MKLNRKLMIGTVGGISLPLLTIWLFFITTGNNTLKRVAISELTTVSESLGNFLEISLNQEKLSLSNFNNDPTMQKVSEMISQDMPDLVQTYLDKYRTIYHNRSLYRVLLIIDTNGKIIADTLSGLYKNQNMSQETFFKRSIKGTTVISKIIKDKNSLYPLTYISAPLLKNRRIIGVIATQWRLNYINEKTSTIKIGHTGFAFIVDDSGNILSYPNRDLLMKNIKNIADLSPIVKNITDKKNIVEKISYRGVKQLVFSTPIKDSNWNLVIMVSENEYLEPINSTKNTILLVAIIFLTLSIIGINLFFKRAVNNPINYLLDNVNRVAAGDLDYVTKRFSQTNPPGRSNKIDEFGQLTLAFRKMAENLLKTTVNRDTLIKEINERRKAEEKLRETEEQYRMQLEGALDAIFISDAKTGMIIDCNPAAAKLVEREKSELVGKHYQILHPADSNIEFDKIFQPHINEKQEQSLEAKIVTKSGRTRYASIKTNLMEIKGKKVLQEVFRDITEQKRAEEELKTAYVQLKTAQLQLVQSAKMASIGLLAGGVAHEINNPLTGVLNNTQLIKMLISQQKEFKPNEFAELLDIIEVSAQRCVKITKSLLNFSRATKGVSEPLSINDLIDKVVVIVEQEMRLRSIAIIKNLAPNLYLVSGDAQLLQQVIFDIISNAIWAIDKKTKKEGGSITLQTKNNPRPRQVVLSISDTGVGIPKQNINSLFDPFFTTKPVGEGTGLGLSLVYNIVQSHKGNIKIESEVNKGTTFHITFPAI